MFRELTSKEAFQHHCLTQMGIASWLSTSEGVKGTVYMPVQPWNVAGVITENGADEIPTQQAAASQVNPHDTTSSLGFAATNAESIKPVAPEEKAKSVHNLREQLSSGPEVIVEDLQPIEEFAVDIDVVPESDSTVLGNVTSLDVRAYALSNKLLIVSDVPHIFSQEEGVERLALNMGKALLKQPIDEWQGSAFSWPATLKNPHFLERTDWLLGAVESYIARLVKTFPSPPMMVLAGDNISQLVKMLPKESALHRYPTARIVSLSELYRIPELRKEAWVIMQSSLFQHPPQENA